MAEESTRCYYCKEVIEGEPKQWPVNSKEYVEVCLECYLQLDRGLRYVENQWTRSALDSNT